MTIIPNVIDNKIFLQMDKNMARQKLGYSQDDFIVTFTGAFSYRKGVLRLSEAMNGIEDKKEIYIGSGDLKLEETNTLF